MLLITVDGLNYSRFEKQMPALAGFAEQIFRSYAMKLRQHYRQRHLWPVLWHLSPSYMDGILVDPYAYGINYCA